MAKYKWYYYFGVTENNEMKCESSFKSKIFGKSKVPISLSTDGLLAVKTVFLYDFWR